MMITWWLMIAYRKAHSKQDFVKSKRKWNCQSCSEYPLNITPRVTESNLSNYVFNIILKLLNEKPSACLASNVTPFQPLLSSPRAKRAGPKGLRAESARAFTGRRNSHSGRGEDFLSRQPIFFTETAVTPERKVEKWFPRWEINRHAQG